MPPFPCFPLNILSTHLPLPCLCTSAFRLLYESASFCCMSTSPWPSFFLLPHLPPSHRSVDIVLIGIGGMHPFQLLPPSPPQIQPRLPSSSSSCLLTFYSLLVSFSFIIFLLPWLFPCCFFASLRLCCLSVYLSSPKAAAASPSSFISS